MLALGNWRPRHLLAAWAAYWAGLVLVTLGPAMLAMQKVIVPQGQHGSVNAGFSDGALNLTVVSSGTTIWHGSALLPVVAWWLAGPPLLLWLFWMLTRPRHAATAEQGSVGGDLLSSAGGERPALHEPMPPRVRDARDHIASRDRRDGDT
jgi:hypothetical protein